VQLNLCHCDPCLGVDVEHSVEEIFEVTRNGQLRKHVCAKGLGLVFGVWVHGFWVGQVEVTNEQIGLGCVLLADALVFFFIADQRVSDVM
jgi:hypothetical protein